MHLMGVWKRRASRSCGVLVCAEDTVSLLRQRVAGGQYARNSSRIGSHGNSGAGDLTVEETWESGVQEEREAKIELAAIHPEKLIWDCQGEEKCNMLDFAARPFRKDLNLEISVLVFVH